MPAAVAWSSNSMQYGRGLLLPSTGARVCDSALRSPLLSSADAHTGLRLMSCLLAGTGPPGTAMPQHCLGELQQCLDTCSIMTNRAANVTTGCQWLPLPACPVAKQTHVHPDRRRTRAYHMTIGSALQLRQSVQACVPCEGLVVCTNASVAAGHHQGPLDFLGLYGSSKLKVWQCSLVHLQDPAKQSTAQHG